LIFGPFKLILRIISMIVSAIFLYFIFTFFQIWMTGHHHTTSNAQAIVVFGTTENNGTPSPELEARLTQALVLWNEQRAPWVVVTEIPAMVDFFFHDQPVMDDAAFTKAIKNDVVAQEMIKAAIARFADVTWEAATLHEEVAALGEGLGLVLRKAQAPIRCAVTGSLVGPPLFESLELLGRENTIARLRRALELVS